MRSSLCLAMAMALTALGTPAIAQEACPESELQRIELVAVEAVTRWRLGEPAALDELQDQIDDLPPACLAVLAEPKVHTVKPASATPRTPGHAAAGAGVPPLACGAGDCNGG